MENKTKIKKQVIAKKSIQDLIDSGMPFSVVSYNVAPLFDKNNSIKMYEYFYIEFSEKIILKKFILNLKDEIKFIDHQSELMDLVLSGKDGCAWDFKNFKDLYNAHFKISDADLHEPKSKVNDI